MVLKACYCLKFSCRGRLLEQAINEEHLRMDRLDQGQRLQHTTDEVLQDQQDQIARYISTHTVLERATGGSRQRAGHPFHFDGPGVETLPSDVNPPSPTSSSFRSLVRGSLEALGPIADDAKTHLRRVQAESASLAAPRDPEEPFPLAPLVEEGQRLLNESRRIKIKAPATIELQRAILADIQRAEELLEVSDKLWKGQQRALKDSIVRNDKDHVYCTDHHFEPILKDVNPALQVFFFAIVAIRILFSIPQRACRFLLQSFRYSLQLALSCSGTKPLTQHQNNLLAGIPDDPRGILETCRLEGKYTIRAVCPDPKCHAQYAPTFSDQSPIPCYPSRCSKRTFNKKCSQPLLRPKKIGDKQILVPVKPFVAFDLVDWIANLNSRSGVEDKLDKPWERAREGGLDVLEDIFHGSVIRELKGPDGKLFSIHGESGHYVFSLCVDFFNPDGNKKGGKAKSVGIISLICLNFPPEERHKPENMFLAGLIPGPTEPPLDCLNHYLTPLVDDLLRLWEPGIHLSRTHRHPHGRLIRCALVAVVCDLPAARKTGGFAGFKHDRFCSICKCSKNSDGYVGKPYHEWERRDNAECRSQAEEYRDAADEATRSASFQTNGMRWSELLRLPYFEPARFVVVDAMHNLFLGLIQEHMRNVLGISVSPTPTERVLTIPLDQEWEHFPKEARRDVQYLKRTLESPITLASEDEIQVFIKRFQSRLLHSLQYMAKMLKLQVPSHRHSPTKSQIATAIVRWRASQAGDAHSSGKIPFVWAGSTLSKSDVEELRADIQAMVMPSWAASVPHNLGDSGHGKLKADQWRLLGTVYVPASLSLRWGAIQADDPRSRFKRRLLEVTISLLSAIAIATSSTTSPSRADLYLIHLRLYVDGIKELFPDYRFRPNHHMAFHIHEYLLMYGPVHGWWCFPFERLIGLLQRIPNNHKPAEYEETIARSFMRGSNLRGMLYKPHCPVAIHQSRPFFEQLINTQSHSPDALFPIPTWASESLEELDLVEVACKWNGRPSKLPDDILDCWNRQCQPADQIRSGNLSSYMSVGGQLYSIASRHAGNSQVMVTSTTCNSGTPAIIRRIFQVNIRGEIKTYVLVQDLEPASVRRSPFIGYSWVRMGFFKDTGPLRIVEPDSLLHNFARLDCSWEGQRVLLVTSLSRS